MINFTFKSNHKYFQQFYLFPSIYYTWWYCSDFDTNIENIGIFIYFSFLIFECRLSIYLPKKNHNKDKNSIKNQIPI